MIKIAAKMLNQYRGSAVATLIALAAGVAILTTMGVLVASGLTYRPAPAEGHENIATFLRIFSKNQTRISWPKTIPALAASAAAGIPPRNMARTRSICMSAAS